MSTQAIKTGSALMPHRLTARQFLKMIQANIFPDGQRVELLRGILSTVVPYDPHDYVVTHLAELVRPRLPGGWTLREEKSVQFGRWRRPDPRISVLKLPSRAFALRSPRPQDIALLVEVSDTAYRKVSGIKLRRYAHVRIPHYWIVNLERRQVEVYRDPQGPHGQACYRFVEILAEDVAIPAVIDGHDLGRIPVKEILP